MKANTVKPALLLVEVMNHFDFPEGKAPGRQAEKVFPNILAWRKRFDLESRPVVYVNDNWAS